MNRKLLLRIALAVVAVAILAAVVMVIVVLPPQLTASASMPPEHTPADAGMAYEEVSFKSHGSDLNIDGWWIPYEGDGELLGTMIFVHGANANREDFWAGGLGLQKMLRDYGHNVLSIDLRNHGTSDYTEDGRLTLGRDEANDVIAAVDYAESRQPGMPVLAFGLSMGGGTVIHAASRDPRIRGLILLDPLLEPYDTMVNGAQASIGLSRAIAAPIAWSAGTFHGTPIFEDRPIDIAKQLTLPVLIIQDEGDPVCRAPYAREVAEANGAVDLWVAPAPADDNPDLVAGGPWGAHVGAYKFYPEEATAITEAFLTLVHTLCRSEGVLPPEGTASLSQ